MLASPLVAGLIGLYEQLNTVVDGETGRLGDGGTRGLGEF